VRERLLRREKKAQPGPEILDPGPILRMEAQVLLELRGLTIDPAPELFVGNPIHGQGLYPRGIRAFGGLLPS
jgi:hypothetical protein